jgi:hypothetical protein
VVSSLWISYAERLQIFQQRHFLGFAQPEMIDFLVVFDDVLQSRKPAVMTKPAFRVAPQSCQRRRQNEMLFRSTLSFKGPHS